MNKTSCTLCRSRKITEFYEDDNGNYIKAKSKEIYEVGLLYRILHGCTHQVSLTYICSDGCAIISLIDCKKYYWIYNASLDEINKVIEDAYKERISIKKTP